MTVRHPARRGSARLTRQTDAERAANVTPDDMLVEPYTAERYGFAVGNTAADNAAALQKLINSTAHAGHGNSYIKSRGRCLVDPTALWFEYDVDDNPNFPSSANRQGQITLVGEGKCDLNAWDNGIYQGTFFDFGTAGLVVGDGVAQIRAVNFKHLTMASNVADFVLKYNLVSRTLELEDFNVFQQHASGSGVEMVDCYLVLARSCFAYNTTANTGTGWHVRNDASSAGLYLLEEVNGLDFNKNFILGVEGTSGGSMNGVHMVNCQGKDGAYNLIIGSGCKASIIDAFHDEGPTVIGVSMAYGATNISLRACYHSNAGASADYMHLGKDTGTGAERYTRNIHVVNNQFTGITNIGIKYWASSLSHGHTIESNSFVGDAGTETGIDNEDANTDALFIPDTNFYSNLAVEVSNPLRVADYNPSDVYTPTLTNVANLDGSTAYQCQYVKNGSVVTVTGKVSVDPTAAAAVTQLGISLPIASNIGAQEDCGGTAFASGIAGQGAAIRGDAANNRAEMVWIAGDVTNQPMYFSFSYRIT